MKRALTALVIAILVFAPRPAFAHAELVSSEPSADSVQEEAPDTVTLTFSDEPLPEGSSIEVTGSDGNSVTVGNPAAGADSLSVRLDPDLTNDTYTVRWNVATADGHVASGSFSFAVRSAATASPSTTPVTSTPPPAGLVTATGTGVGTNGSGGSSPFGGMVPVAAAAIAAAVIAAAVAFRKRSIALWVAAGVLAIAGVALVVISPTSSDRADATFRLTATPGTAGPNAFSAEFLTTAGRPLDADAVTLRFDLAGGDALGGELPLTRADGRWTGQGEPLTEIGTWIVTALVQTPDAVVEIPATLITRSEALEPAAPGVASTTASFASGVALQIELDPDAGRVNVRATTPDGAGLELEAVRVVATRRGEMPEVLDAQTLGKGRVAANLALWPGVYTIDVVATTPDARSFQATLVDVEIPA